MSRFRRFVDVLGTCLLASSLTAAAGSGAGAAMHGAQAEGSTGRVWTTVSAGGWDTCGVRTDQSLWCWGANNRGQLGLGYRSRRGVSTPSQVDADTDWAGVSVPVGGEDVCGIRTDQTLWCWGRNSYGELGLGYVSKYVSTPTQVDADTDWVAVSAGGFHTCGTRTDGTVWCWGWNTHGQLGLGEVSKYVSSPTQVGADTDWAAVTAGYDHTCASRIDQTLWCWGGNSDGQLGVGDTRKRLTPTEVDPGTDWAHAWASEANTCGIQVDRTLWCWGWNGDGQLGVGDTTDRDTPTQVGTNPDWATIGAGGGHTCGVRTDDTLWCWGAPAYGELGLGPPFVNVTSPAQVGTDADWATIGAGGWHTCGTRTNNTMWCWGGNAYGQLGLGGTRDRHTPKRV